MVHAVKYRKEDKLKIDIIETKHHPEKQIQNYHSLVASNGKETRWAVGLFYNAPEFTRSVMALEDGKVYTPSPT